MRGEYEYLVKEVCDADELREYVVTHGLKGFRFVNAYMVGTKLTVIMEKYHYGEPIAGGGRQK